MLARLTLVNYNYQVLFDELVAPEHPVINYLTKFSGIT
jgi:RNA exonuclease 1